MSKAILLTVEVSASSVLFMAHARHVAWADTKLVDAVLVLNTQSSIILINIIIPINWENYHPNK